jgi:hypothetical protein
MINSPKGYRWLYVDENGNTRSTHSNLNNVNPPGREAFSSKEEAEQALTSWITQSNSQDRDQYKLLEVF